jgi:hypothetical protein
MAKYGYNIYKDGKCLLMGCTSNPKRMEKELTVYKNAKYKGQEYTFKYYELPDREICIL